MNIPIFNKDVIDSRILHQEFVSEDAVLWFRSAPKYTSARVNCLKLSPECLVETIRDSLCQFNQPDVRVYVHDVLPDCAIVENRAVKFTLPEEGISEVMVDCVCAAAVLRGASVFAPGVLSMLPYVKHGDRVNVFCDLLGKCKKGLATIFDGAKLYLGQGIVLKNRSDIFSQNKFPSGIAVEILDTVSGIPQFHVDSTLCTLQNLPSMLCTYELDVNEFSLVLDMCASPGNKTTHIATRMNNNGTVIALDKTPKKIAAIESKCKELGISNMKCFVADSRYIVNGDSCQKCKKEYQKKDKFPKTRCLENEDSSEQTLKDCNCPKFPEEHFNRILLDAPCSALGQRPLLVCKTSLSQIRSFPPLQKQLFCTAYKLLKPGGILVYSTCTVTVDENEGLVSWALRKFPSLHLCKPNLPYGKSGLADDNLLSDEDLKKVQRFGPPCKETPESDTIGFFIAKFMKN